jgi:GNAT superfamily N-acetyltransferase
VDAPVLTLADIGFDAARALLARYGLALERTPDDTAIPGSFWGEREAGLIGATVFARADTPVHSLLHEACHLIVMPPERRAGVHTDASDSVPEEDASCYLQILLADELPGVGRDRLLADMDAWGYTFRLGSARRWFEEDAEDARQFLADRGLLAGLGEMALTSVIPGRVLPMSLSISRASVADLDALVPLFRGYLDFYRREATPGAIQEFLDARLRNQQSVIFLAHVEGRAVGFTQLYPAFASLSLKPNWILNDLFVLPDARGHGAASALMEAARQLAVDTGACELFLQTARDNTTAQRLYERLGYVRDDDFYVYSLGVPGP